MYHHIPNAQKIVLLKKMVFQGWLQCHLPVICFGPAILPVNLCSWGDEKWDLSPSHDGEIPVENPSSWNELLKKKGGLPLEGLHMLNAGAR